MQNRRVTQTPVRPLTDRERLRVEIADQLGDDLAAPMMQAGFAFVILVADANEMEALSIVTNIEQSPAVLAAFTHAIDQIKNEPIRG